MKRVNPTADLMTRERNGRFEAGLDRLCQCGHTLGVHVAGGHECIVADAAPTAAPTAPVCQCEKFRATPKLARKRRSPLTPK